MTRDEMMQDLAYARALAEEGRHAPLLGGAHLVFWGVANTVAFAAHWGILEGRLPALEGRAFALLWLGYGVVATFGMVLLRLRTRRKPGLSAIGVRAERAMWIGAAVGVGAIALGSIARMMMEGDPTAPNAIFGAAFALYGAALFGTARLSQEAWLARFAWLSAGVAFTLCLFANAPWAYLYAAVGSVLVLIWPGIILLRREPPPSV
jgi:hypothetical protein